jgi:transposase
MEQRMATPYSQDLRDRVLAAYDRGMRTRQIALTFEVSPAWARRVKQRRRETGQTTPRPMGGPWAIKVDRVRLAELVRADPDATLMELRDRLGVPCGISTICTALKNLGFTFKKRRSTRRSRIVRTWSRSANTGAAGARPLIHAG